MKQQKRQTSESDNKCLDGPGLRNFSVNIGKVENTFSSNFSQKVKKKKITAETDWCVANVLNRLNGRSWPDFVGTKFLNTFEMSYLWRRHTDLKRRWRRSLEKQPPVFRKMMSTLVKRWLSWCQMTSFFVVLACHSLVLDGFDWHFQHSKQRHQ